MAGPGVNLLGGCCSLGKCVGSVGHLIFFLDPAYVEMSGKPFACPLHSAVCRRLLILQSTSWNRCNLLLNSCPRALEELSVSCFHFVCRLVGWFFHWHEVYAAAEAEDRAGKDLLVWMVYDTMVMDQRMRFNCQNWFPWLLPGALKNISSLSPTLGDFWREVFGVWCITGSPLPGGLQWTAGDLCTLLMPGCWWSARKQDSTHMAGEF